MDPVELACLHYGITKESGFFQNASNWIKGKSFAKGLSAEGRQLTQGARNASSLHQFTPPAPHAPNMPNPSQMGDHGIIQGAKNTWNNLTPNQQLGAIGAAGLGAGYMYGNSNNSR